jgi:tetratricopeptide (TPR) repeat protein
MLMHGVLLLLLTAGPVAPPANSIAAELDRGQALLSSGNLAGALAAFDAAAKLDRNDPRPIYLRGVVLEKKNDRTNAEKAYRQAIAIDPKLAPAQNNLGALLLAKNDFAGAEPALKAATGSDPNHAGAWFNLGLLRELQTTYPLAIAAYRKAVALKPKEATYRMNLSTVLRRSGDLDGALTEAKVAVQLAPEQAMTLVNLGLLLSDKRAFDEAKAVLDKATRLDPKSTSAWVGLGRVEQRRKQPAAAVAALAKAMDLAPKDARIAADYCRAQVELDVAGKGAIEACQKAVALDGQNALAHYELLKVKVVEGDCVAAKAVLVKFQSLGQVKPEAKEKAAEIVKTCVIGKPAKKIGPAPGKR